jgi:hypothetical protein
MLPHERRRWVSAALFVASAFLAGAGVALVIG